MFAQCEAVAGQPQPFLRIRQESGKPGEPGKWARLTGESIRNRRRSLVNRVAEVPTRMEDIAALAIAEMIAEAPDTPGSDDGNSDSDSDIDLEASGANTAWERHKRWIRPPDDFDPTDVSDCIPWLRRTHLVNRCLEIFSLIIILLSITSFCLETLPQYRLKADGTERGDPLISFFILEVSSASSSSCRANSRISLSISAPQAPVLSFGAL